MKPEQKCTSCSKHVELMLLTREEDFKELNAKIAEVQRIQDRKLQALVERMARLEESMSR